MRGLGVDLCQVGRIERALQGGDAFLQRFFTAGERDYLAALWARICPREAR